MHYRSGIDICIRDDQGSFVLTKIEWFAPILDVDTGEAVGLLHALKWVQELQLKNVDFEFDSKNVVAKFHSKARDISRSVGVIKDCQFIHNSHFRNSRVEFVRK
jgi:ribonuclease HI